MPGVSARGRFRTVSPDVMSVSPRVLVIDHKDSFVHNLARYFHNLGCRPTVLRVAELVRNRDWHDEFDLLVLSPGPCRPEDAGSVSLVRAVLGRIPILGVCLGHQVLAAALGGMVVRARRPCHGEPSWMLHDGRAEFAGFPNPMCVGRYHSLVVDGDALPTDITISGWLADGTIMAIRQETYRVVGWQFHPESVLTPQGSQLMASFLRWALGVTPGISGVGFP